MVNFKNGETPINDINLNKLQTDLIENKYRLKITTTSSAGTAIALPCSYKVRS